MTYLHTRIALPLIFAASSGLADGPLWTIDGLDMPESAVVDAAQGRIVVSLIGGHPQEADGNGALALLSEDGALIDPAWITGSMRPRAWRSSATGCWWPISAGCTKSTWPPAP